MSLHPPPARETRHFRGHVRSAWAWTCEAQTKAHAGHNIICQSVPGSDEPLSYLGGCLPALFAITCLHGVVCVIPDFSQCVSRSFFFEISYVTRITCKTKQALEILLILNSLLEISLWESGPKIEPATGVRSHPFLPSPQSGWKMPFWRETRVPEVVFSENDNELRPHTFIPSLQGQTLNPNHSTPYSNPYTSTLNPKPYNPTPFSSLPVRLRFLHQHIGSSAVSAPEQSPWLQSLVHCVAAVMRALLRESWCCAYTRQRNTTACMGSLLSTRDLASWGRGCWAAILSAQPPDAH